MNPPEESVTFCDSNKVMLLEEIFAIFHEADSSSKLEGKLFLQTILLLHFSTANTEIKRDLVLISLFDTGLTLKSGDLENIYIYYIHEKIEPNEKMVLNYFL